MAIEILSAIRLPVAPVLPFDVARKVDIISGDTVDYSLQSLDTETKWVDGSSVFRRVFISQTGAATNALHVVATIPSFAGLVRLDGYLISADGYYIPVNYNTGAAASFFACMIHTNGTIIESHGNPQYNGRRMVILLDFIQTPVGLTIWDFGTTVWDGGATEWDI